MSAPRWVYRGKLWEYWLPDAHCTVTGRVLATVERLDDGWGATVFVRSEIAGLDDADHGRFDTLEEAKRAVVKAVEA